MKEINTAMNAVLKACRNISHDEGKGHGKSLNYSYISNEKVMDFFRPLLAENGLSFSFGLLGGRSWREDKMYFFEGAALATFRHVSGETIEVPYFVCGQNNGGIDKAMGSALTYGMRYFLLKQFLVASSDEEDPDARQDETTQEAKKPMEAPGLGADDLARKEIRERCIAYANQKGLLDIATDYSKRVGKPSAQMTLAELQGLEAELRHWGEQGGQ